MKATATKGRVFGSFHKQKLAKNDIFFENAIDFCV